MPTVAKYGVRIFGGQDGKGNVRAALQLHDSSHAEIGNIYCYEEMEPPSDSESGGVITMNVTISELPYLVDLLRHEKPVTINHNANSQVSFLRVGPEPVGEEE